MLTIRLTRSPTCRQSKLDLFRCIRKFALVGLVLANSMGRECRSGALQGYDRDPVATSRKAMIATVHPLATNAGLQALDRGGNAIDAAIAAALTLGVVDGYNSGIGGGCLILIRTAHGQFVAIDGRETAPAAAHRDLFVRDGRPESALSQHGPLAVAVPGALAAYAEALQDYGNLPLHELLLRAAEIAEEGFEVSPQYAFQIASSAEHLRQYAGPCSPFFDEAGQPLSVGSVLKQTALAHTYRQIAAAGTDWFYRGAFAEQTADWMAAHGGLLTAHDFADYRTIRREPIVSDYRGYQIVGFPPPSSGGVLVAQMLNILEEFDLAEIYQRDPVELAHVVSEAMKLAFADRAFWLGDPAFADVPRGLVHPDYARSLAQRIRRDQTIDVLEQGNPTEFDPRWFEKHTTHVAAADDQGNWVALTTTVNTTFGSKVIVPELGVVMNNQMDDFAIAPGAPNAFGLVGSDANQVAPGKRPLSSMSPTIVLRDGEPVMTIGAAGGPRIITQVLLGLIRYLDLDQPIAEAIAQPRYHQQWSPPYLFLERGADPALFEGLARRGHRVEWTRNSGVTQAIVRRADEFYGVADPRADGRAAGR